MEDDFILILHEFCPDLAEEVLHLDERCTKRLMASLKMFTVAYFAEAKRASESTVTRLLQRSGEISKPKPPRTRQEKLLFGLKELSACVGTVCAKTYTAQFKRKMDSWGGRLPAFVVEWSFTYSPDSLTCEMTDAHVSKRFDNDFWSSARPMSVADLVLYERNDGTVIRCKVRAAKFCEESQLVFALMCHSEEVTLAVIQGTEISTEEQFKEDTRFKPGTTLCIAEPRLEVLTNGWRGVRVSGLLRLRWPDQELHN
ncbi:MAG: uncharacterized protein KVP18_002734 [Porospora cf. gigantea A]|uniref:uncharacterized protein n=1 Tax=Porospora cf. gigantea A TaxID=2853593 RepID=UPI00355A2EC5|nr:MAG: hypothetical protein KVP18_002734 [Porospora cf. gigantea A]